MDDLCFICQENKYDDSIICDFKLCRVCYNQQYKNIDYFEDKRTKYFPEIDMIINNLFLGNRDASYDKELLDKNKIKAIVVMGKDLKIKFPNDFIYFKYEVNDSLNQDLFCYFKEINQIIDSYVNKKENVFVHCSAGVSRSSTIVISYIMYLLKISFEEAFKLVESKRHCILPNSSFKEQLIKYEKELGLNKQ